MHNSAYKNAEKFYLKYCSNNIEEKIVLDVGSIDLDNMGGLWKDSVGVYTKISKNRS